jgi:DNA-binding MarR family transcriptional regulator
MTIKDQVKQRTYRDRAEQAFVGLLFVGGRLFQSLEDVCAEHGLTHTQYNVLRILRGVHPAGHPRCEIADRLITRAPDVTRLLDRLERQGLIERTWSKENRRLSMAKITRRGIDVLQRLDPAVKALEQSTVGRLTASEQKDFARMCDQMVEE